LNNFRKRRKRMKSGKNIWKQMMMALAVVLLAGVMAVAVPGKVFADETSSEAADEGDGQAEDIASGTNADGSVTWTIDADGKLTVTGTGDVERIKVKYTP
jgi:hypothetical protein